MAEAQDSLEVSDLKENFLECSVCLEHFDQAERRPRLLVNCLHSFCSQCLEQLLEKEGTGQVTCPNCRQVQKIKGNAQSLPVDPVRNKLVDYVQFKKGKKILCTDCPDGSHAVARCHECQSYMCAPCKEAHHRNRLSRKHTCQSLEEALSEPVKNFHSHHCEDHPDQKIKFFCGQCSNLCCVSCPIVKHRGHILDPIEDAANSMLSSLKTKIREVEKSASVFRGEKTSLKEKSKMQKVNLKHKTASINKTFDDLIGKFNCQRNKLIYELRDKTESTVIGLGKQCQAIEDRLLQMESTLEYFKLMESNSDDCEVLSAGPILVKSLEAAAAVDQTRDVQHPTWIFSPGEMDNVISMVQRTGVIHSDTASRSDSFQMSDPSQSGASSLEHQASSVGPKVDAEASIEEVDAEGIGMNLRGPSTKGKLGYCKKMLSCHELPVDLNEDTLSNYVEVFGDCEVKKLEFSLDQTAALVTVDNEPDWEKLTKTRHEEKKKIRFEQLFPSSSICVLFNQDNESNMQKLYSNLTPKPIDTSTVKRGKDLFHVITFSSPDDVEAVLRKKDQLAKEYKMLMSVYFESVGPVKKKSEMVVEEEVELTVGQSQLLLKTKKLEEMRTYVDIEIKNKRTIVVRGKPKAVSHVKVVIQDFKKQFKERKVECSMAKQKYIMNKTCGQLMHLRMRGKNIEGTWYESRRQLMICATSDADLDHIADWIDRHLKEKFFDSSSEEFKQALRAIGHMEDGLYLLYHGNYHRELVLVTQHEEFHEACQIVDGILAGGRDGEVVIQNKQNEISRTSLQESIKETITKDHKLFLQRFKQKDLKALEKDFNVSIFLEGPDNEVIISGQGNKEALESFKAIVRDLKTSIMTLSPESSTQILNSGFLGCLEKFVGDTERCVISHKIQQLANESVDESLEGAVGGANLGHSSGHSSGHGSSSFREGGRSSSSPELKIPNHGRGNRTFLKQIQFIVKKGEIAKEKSDIIVNTVIKGLDMKAEATAKSLFAAGGLRFEKEFKDEEYKLHEGGFVVTDGGNLKCKYVFHCCLCPSTSVHAEEFFQRVMSEMLKYADKLNMKTVSFHALGTGLLGYLPESSANIMYNAVMEYSKTNQNIEEVRIVINKNKKALKAFKEAERAVSGGRTQEPFSWTSLLSPTPVVPPRKRRFKVGSIPVVVKQGDLSQEPLEAVVNLMDASLSFKSDLYKALLKVGGKKFEDHTKIICDKLRRDGIASVRMKNDVMVVHVDRNIVKYGLKEVLFRCLEYADYEHYKNIGFPIMQTEGNAAEGMATDMIDAIGQFNYQREKPTIIEEVYVVIHKLDQFHKFSDCLKRKCVSQPVSMTEPETEKGQITFTITSDEQPLILRAKKVLSEFCKDSWVVGMLPLPPSISTKDIREITFQNDVVQIKDISISGKKTLKIEGKSNDILKAINDFHRQFKTEFAEWEPDDGPDKFEESDVDENQYSEPLYT